MITSAEEVQHPFSAENPKEIHVKNTWILRSDSWDESTGCKSEDEGSGQFDGKSSGNDHIVKNNVKEGRVPTTSQVKPVYDKPDSSTPLVYCVGREVMTDISVISNTASTTGAAGIGVFWGFNDPRNLEERLWGSPQTSRRAALCSAIRALQACLSMGLRKVEIRCDCKYLVKGVGQWRRRWQKNGGLFTYLDTLLNLIDVTWVIVECCPGNHSYDAAISLAMAGAKKQFS